METYIYVCVYSVCTLTIFMLYLGSFHKPGSAAWFMSTSHKANPSAQNISRISLLSEEASHIITQK